MAKKTIKKKRPKYNLKSRITSALRKIWLYSPMRRSALARFKANGNLCENPTCKKPIEKPEVDHKVPVARLEGWDENWTSYIQRLMCHEDLLICLCHECHSAKTSIQRIQRQINKKA